VVVLVSKVRPLAFLVRRPERSTPIHDLLAVLSNNRFHINAAGRWHRKIVSRVALAVGVHIGRRQIALVQNVVGGLVLVTVGLLFLLFLFPLLLDELKPHFLGNGFAGIVSRLHANLRGVALVVNVSLGISIGDSFATRADE